MDNQLTLDDLRAYQAGQLSGPARHRVERLLLEDPFYADALAGLEAMQQTGTSTSPQLAELRDALQQRIHESATKKRLWPLWIATTTAAILFMLAVAIYLIFFAPKQPVKSKPIDSPKTVQTDSAPIDELPDQTNSAIQRQPGHIPSMPVYVPPSTTYMPNSTTSAYPSESAKKVKLLNKTSYTPE